MIYSNKGVRIPKDTSSKTNTITHGVNWFLEMKWLEAIHLPNVIHWARDVPNCVHETKGRVSGQWTRTKITNSWTLVLSIVFG